MVGSRPDRRMRRHRVPASLRLGSALLATVVLTVGLGIRPAAAASTIVATPLPTGTTRSRLADITCASATMCWAVGTVNVNGEDNQYLIQRWNGTSWSIAKQGRPVDYLTSSLKDATCSSPTNCWAVGPGFILSDAPIGEKIPIPPLAIRWNGTKWARVATPIPAGSDWADFNDVACISAANCWAVGRHGEFQGTGRRMMARWNGTAWSVVTGQTPKSGGASNLEGVTCASSTVCWALGAVGANRLVLRWNGSVWSTVTPPLPAGTTGSAASDVACSGASTCWIVGAVVVSGSARRLVQRWNGSTWSIVTTTLPTGITGSALTAVTCFGATSCWALGVVAKSGAPQPLVVRWNGTTWSHVAAPIPTGATETWLASIACTGALACWAVGEAKVAGSWRRLVIRFTP